MKFNVVLADPPWSYKTWSPKGAARSASAHYDTLSLLDIANLPIGGVVEKDCALFLWLPDWMPPSAAQQVMETWGFSYRTRAWVWVKTTADGKKWHMGMGKYTRANPEDCWLGVRGRMPVADHGVLSLLVAPVGEHSAKPDRQYEKIERLYPKKKYLELFARKRREGWVSLGYDLDGQDIRGSLRALAKL